MKESIFERLAEIAKRERSQPVEDRPKPRERRGRRPNREPRSDKGIKRGPRPTPWQSVPGRTVKDRMILAAQPGAWYALSDLARLLGLKPIRGYNVRRWRVLEKGYFTRRKNPVRDRLRDESMQ